MIKNLAGLAVSLLLAHASTLPGYAQDSMPDPRVEQLLQKLEMLASPPSQPAAIVSRTFAVRVRTTITVLSSLSLPHNLMCQVFLTHFTSDFRFFYTETKGQKIVTPAPGGSIVCDITTNVKWPNADDTRTVSIGVAVRPLIKRLASLPNEEEYVRNRTSTASLPPIPLPAQGTTTLVTHALSL